MTIDELLDICINESLIDLVISGVKNKSVQASKIKVRPVMLKDTLKFQASEYVGAKVLHSNFETEQIKKKIKDWLNDYKQGQFVMTDGSASVLSGKNGNITVKYKKSVQQRQQKELAHNRSKKYILMEGTPVGFLVDLGVMTKHGKIVSQKYDKYRQINRFLEFVEDILPKLDKSKEQTIIDFGCGKSYLTFAMYYYLKELKGYDIRIIGLDLKEDVIAKCNELRTKYGYEKLDFYVGDIASYKDVDRVDMVVTLHACDTATDYALAKAVKWGAKVILSVPCCQHEANSMIGKSVMTVKSVTDKISEGESITDKSSEGKLITDKPSEGKSITEKCGNARNITALMGSKIMTPVLNYGILKERMAALCTDAVRAGLLEEAGYETQILEFIDMEHTPKNLLIRAVYTGNSNVKAGEDARNMENALGFKLTLNGLLEAEK